MKWWLLLKCLLRLKVDDRDLFVCKFAIIDDSHNMVSL